MDRSRLKPARLATVLFLVSARVASADIIGPPPDPLNEATVPILIGGVVFASLSVAVSLALLVAMARRRREGPHAD